MSGLQASLVYSGFSLTFWLSLPLAFSPPLSLFKLIKMQKGAENNKICILFPCNIIYQAMSLENQE